MRYYLSLCLLLLVSVTNAADRFPLPAGAYVIDVPKLRNVSAQQLGPVLADIDCRLPAAGLVSSPTYRCDDYGTWAHEANHGVQSLVRNKYGRGTGQDNAFYLLAGRAWLIAEPRPVTMQTAANYVPRALRESAFQLYMVEQRQDWDDTPLYVLDEWNSYLNGAIYNWNRAEYRQSIGDGYGDLHQTAQLGMYSLSVAIAVDARLRSDPQFKYDDTQLRMYIAWNWNRMMQLFADAQQYKQFKDPVPYYRIFATAPECQNWRQWCRGYFGPEWANGVMLIAAD